MRRTFLIFLAVLLICPVAWAARTFDTIILSDELKLGVRPSFNKFTLDAQTAVGTITPTTTTGNAWTWTLTTLTTGNGLLIKADDDILNGGKYINLYGGTSADTTVWNVGEGGIQTFKGGATMDNATSATVLNLTEDTVRVTGILDVTLNSTLASLDVGGGYAGGSGATISAAGVGQFNGAVTADGGFTALTGTFTADDITDGVVDMVALTHSSSDNAATAGDGIGITFDLENATGTSLVEEWGNIDVLSTTITNGSEDGDMAFSLMAGGTVVPGMLLDSSDQSLTIGQNVTDADGFSKLRIYPVTTATGSVVLSATANTGDSVTTITNAAQGGAYTYTIPNAGSGYFGVSTAALTLAEMDVLDGVVAGTAAASKAAVLGATKNLDTLVIADGGLYLGAGAGTAVTSTAAELNFLDTSVAGTAVASKAAVLGASKNLDTLVIADGGLYLGAGAGTAVTSTAAELNTLDGVAATLTAIELNTLDGVAATLTAIELNTLDGVAATLTAIELNTLDGVAATLTAAELNILDGVTSTAAELNILDGVTSTAAELNIVDGVTATAAEINVVAGGIARSELTEDVLQAYGIPLYSLRQADMAAMGVTATAGDHYTDLSANVIRLWGEIANNNTKTDVSYFQFVLPPSYVSAGDCKIRIKHQITGAGTGVASTTDVEVYEQTAGTVGADLVTTVAATSVKDSWTTTEFVVTATTLVAGDILNVKVTTACIETAVANLQSQVDGVAVLLDVKG